jgi:uncharacterized integral membrane protein
MADGSEVYADFVQSMLDAEDSRKSSLEQRGIGVITTSGTLVTLLFGLTAAITSAKNFTLPAAVRDWLAPAAILFVAAAAAGILVNVPLFYGKIEVSRATLEPAWADDAPDARAAVTDVRLRRLQAAQGVNSVKAWILVAAAALELAAVAMLTVGIVHII